MAKKNKKKVLKTSEPKNVNRWNAPAIFLLVTFIGLYVASTMQKKESSEISYTTFKQLVKEGAVQKVVINGQKIHGQLFSQRLLENRKVKLFTSVMPPIDDQALMPLIEDKKVELVGQIQEDPWVISIFLSLLPWLLIIGFFYYTSQLMKKRLGGATDKDNPFSFYKSKARLFVKSKGQDINFNDVAGCDNAKKELEEIVEFLKSPEKFQKIGATLPKGVLLVGPPGTGKTLMARAVAGEANVPFLSLSASEFIEMFVGVGASRVRDLFAEAKKSAPSIIFIDEIDSIGRSRGTGLGGGHDEREQTLNQILSEMDGFDKNVPVVVIAATNRPDVLDSALIRPGRFDRHVTLDLPQKEAREKILMLHTKKIPLDQEVDLAKIAGGTAGFSGAMLKNLVNEAAICAARAKREIVLMEDFEDARDKIILGIKRNAKLDEKQKKLVAYHESGHAVAAYCLHNTDPLTKITIIPRGQALGFTEQTPEEDVYNISKSYLLDKIAILLAGRTSEEIIFGEITTGAENDLKEATKLARKMVANWGMSDELGEVFYNIGEEHPFLGREIIKSRDFSDSTAKELDDSVRRIIQVQKDRVKSLLNEKRKVLDILASTLLEKETLNVKEINEIMEANAVEA